MDTINRFLFTVRRREPWVAWANTLCGSGPTTSIEKVNAEPSAYLVSEYDSDPDGAKALRDYWPEIFALELESWHTDEAAWPKKRTLKMFREWFDVSFSSMVFDLSDDVISYDL